MRVIAGTYRSRVLTAPRGDATRPTSDRLRETLFNVLGPRIQDANFADLFAGTGAVGIEAISRGAAFTWFAENDAAALAALRKNLSTLKITAGYALDDRGTERLLGAMQRAGHQADIVFLDPPYDDEEAYARTLGTLGGGDAPLLKDGAIVIAEHHRKYPLRESFGALKRYRVLEQGDAALSFFTVAGTD